MSEITFTETEIPAAAKSGRTPLPNPFKAAFPCDDKALTFSITEGRNSVEARRVVRQVRQAAKAVDRTGRVDMTDLPNGGVEFRVWTVARVTRNEKAEAPKAAPAKGTKVAAK